MLSSLVTLEKLMNLFFFSFLKRFIYYLFYLFLAVLGLICGTWDLSLQRAGSSLWCAGFSLVVVFGFSLSSCGARAPGHVGSVVCSTWALAERARA